MEQIIVILLLGAIISTIKYIYKYTSDTSSDVKKILNEKESIIVNNKKTERNLKFKKYFRYVFIALMMYSVAQFIYFLIII